MAKAEKEDKVEIVVPEGAAKGSIRDNAEVICFAVLLIMFFKTFVGQQFTIPTASMRNTLMIGDHLLVNKFIFATPQWDWEAKLFPMRKVERGDIIVFRYPMDRNFDYVKRCIALPGDTFEIKDKHVYINGNLVTGEFEHHFGDIKEVGPTAGPWPLTRSMEPTDPSTASVVRRNLAPVAAGVWPFGEKEYLTIDRQGESPLMENPWRDNLGPLVVPEGHVLAMGDNRDNSLDSRYWGFLPIDHLRGRPFMIWWSYREGGNDDTSADVPNGPGDVVKNFVEGARYFFTRTRWERSGHIPR
jgi:signal peptidase I